MNMTPRNQEAMVVRSPRYLDREVRLLSARELATTLFRYRRAAFLVFVAVLALAVTWASLVEVSYEAEMKILVKRERLDPVITTDAEAPSTARIDVSESELYGEVELLTSRDLMEQVARATGLLSANAAENGSVDDEVTVSRVVELLMDDLEVEPIRKTNLIRVAYRSEDSQHAVAVLGQLGTLYLQKHLTVHRPAGARQFFSEQASQYEGELRVAETRLKEFSAREQIVSAAQEKETALAKVSEFEGTLQQTLAAIADSTRRLAAIDAELASVPDRQVTQVRDEANVETIRSLRAQILQLDIKRQDMLRKFTPEHPPLAQVEQELALLRSAMAAAEKQPLLDETTDQNPTHQWLRNESARVQTEHKALIARAEATRRAVEDYKQRARRLDAVSYEQQELLRAVKEAEEHYLLYRRKQEEARISDALDRTRIANVTIAEAPWVPESPTSRRGLIVVGGALAALLLSVGVALALHAANPYFRTSEEVRAVLDVPVLASLPATTE